MSRVEKTSTPFRSMKKQTFIFALTILTITTFSSCAAVGGIFKAGMGVGVFIVVLVVAAIIFFACRRTGSK